jgi:hypothetical protein
MGMELVYVLVVLALICIAIAILYSPKQKSKISPEEKPDVYQDQAQPGQGVLNNVGTRFQARSDTKTQEVINKATEEANKGIALATERRSHHQTFQRQEAETQAYLAQKLTEQKEHQLRERLIDLALAQGFDVDTYLKQRLDELEIEKLERETMVKLKGGFVYQLQDYQKLTMLRSQLDELYEREHLIESGNEPESVKQKKLAQVKADIETLEKDANGRRQGLLQAYNGEEAGGSNPDSEP